MSKVFNADRLEQVKPRILELEESGVEFWVPPFGFFEFGVASGLAPQLVEEPFLTDYLDIFRVDSDHVQYLVPREHTKTSIWQTAAAYVICEGFEHLGGYQVRVCFAKATQSLAKDSVRATRSSLELNEHIRSRYGRQKPTRELVKALEERHFEKTGDKSSFSLPPWSSESFSTMKSLEQLLDTGRPVKEPNCWAQGFDKDATGNHMHLLIVDDGSNEKNSKSAVMKAKVNSVFDELNSQLLANGLMVDNGTRHAPDDCHGYIQENYFSDYKVIVRDCFDGGPRLERKDFERTFDANGRRFFKLKRPLDEVKILWEGFGQLEEDVVRGFAIPPDERKALALSNLAAKMHRMPWPRFVNQYLNICIASADQVFRETWFRSYSGRTPYGTPYVLTDAATGKDYRSSYRVVATAIVTPESNVYFEDIYFGRPGTRDFCNEIFDQYLRSSARLITFEKMAWTETYTSAMEMVAELRGIPVPRVEIIPGRELASKVERIIGCEPFFSAGKAFFHESLYTKICDDRPVMEEVWRQFQQVHEEMNVKGLLLDIPDCLSDAWARNKDGDRICRPARRRRTSRAATLTEQMEEGAHEKTRNMTHRQVSGGGIWGGKGDVGKKKGGLWG